MKETYLRLMELSLSAYSDAHIDAYFDSVKRDRLREHGFPRLTANIGILIAHGRRTDLYSRFVEMMDFCCASIPNGKAANDFSVREIVACLSEVEAARVVPEEKIEGASSHDRSRNVLRRLCKNADRSRPQLGALYGGERVLPSALRALQF